ncbi:hypothetical protein P4V52_14895, partial [Brevibacillus formosus]|uniref:hypothetical protein n=1 Tax=Brevibacillus formosus TaxID=54913 RepID=UPI002E249E10|nr:hypothetical protein [Brevibacillus formosus]
FKAGKSFHDRLINAFAVQFSKSIFTSTSKALDSQYTMYHYLKSTGNNWSVSFCSALFERRITNIA